MFKCDSFIKFIWFLGEKNADILFDIFHICVNWRWYLLYLTICPTDKLATSNMAASAMPLAVSFPSAPLRDNSSSTTFKKQNKRLLEQIKAHFAPYCRKQALIEKQMSESLSISFYN